MGDLLRERAEINRRLRQIPIFRTKGNHLVPLSEEIVARMMGGWRGSEGQPGWDVITPDGVTIQAKAGAISSPFEYRTFGGARPGRVADWYAFVAVDDWLTRVWWLFMIPADEVPDDFRHLARVCEVTAATMGFEPRGTTGHAWQ